MKLITPTALIWFCKILRTAESKFTSRKSRCLGLNHCSKKDNVILFQTLPWLKIVSAVGHKIRRTMVFEDAKPQEPIVTIDEFLHGAVKKMVASIRECEQNTHCIVYARIRRLHKENGWVYTACKECNRKVDVVECKASLSFGKSKVTFYYEEHDALQSSSAPIGFFKTMINKLFGHTACELMEKHGMDVDEYWHEELDKLVVEWRHLDLARALVAIRSECVNEEEDEVWSSSKMPKLVNVKIGKED
ncbi:replication protein A 70 kDa DNA-binding subunit B [Tanacetum coccineum]